MKAQTLGLVLGMNMAVACLVMQGCKAVKPGQELPPEPTTTSTVEVTTDTTPTPTVQDAGVTQQEALPQQEPLQPVRKVKPLPKQAKPETPAVVKKPAEKTAAPAAAETTVHTVQRGEYLSSISKKYNVKMSAIVAANPGLNPNRIRIGQKLKIPAGSAAAAKSNVMLASAPAPAATAANTTAPVKTKPSFKPYTGPTKEYVVKGGDSLGKIAYENGITIRALKELNGLTKDHVRVGQKLKVPAEKVVAEKKPAEAPAAKPAADKKDAAAPAADAEQKKPATDEAKPAEAAAAPAADDAKPAEAAPSGNTYTVKEGDDLVGVAIMWGISPSQLINLNDLKEGEALKPGTVLKLPANAKQTVQ